MAQAATQPFSALTTRFSELPNSRKVAIMVAVAALVAMVVAVLLWAQKPAQKTLFANLSDKDSGAVVASLQQMNIPYTVEPGNVIMVPENVVYDTRIKLATQGLPKSGAAGFELMDNQRLGISQFAEQVSYQRAVEGELSRSIESIDAIESARVHLAFPKSTVFVREQQKPTASILLNLRGGRTLDEAQIAGIMHLVANSVPDLPMKNVSIVDQRGNLLSDNTAGARPGGLDAKQLDYVHQVESSFARRIEEILSPVWGKDNIKAQVTAQLDFAQTEQTSETFKPNGAASEATVRSQQTVETIGDGSTGAGGVPGALSNQPPGAATAPLTATNPPGSTTPNATTGSGTTRHRENTTNYEVDKTVSHTLLPTGSVKRLSVAVVVNYKKKTVSGKDSFVPLTRQELGQVENLAREAMGFNQQRGDSLNVVNAQFADSQLAAAAPTSLVDKVMAQATLSWMDWLKYAVIGGIAAYLFFGVLRPLMRDLTGSSYRMEPQLAGAGAGAGQGGTAGVPSLGPDGEVMDTVNLSPEEQQQARQREDAEEAARVASYADNLSTAKNLAKEDPRMVATIIREWIVKEDDA